METSKLVKNLQHLPITIYGNKFDRVVNYTMGHYSHLDNQGTDIY